MNRKLLAILAALAVVSVFASLLYHRSLILPAQKAVHQATTKLPNADTVEKAFQETLAEAAEGAAKQAEKAKVVYEREEEALKAAHEKAMVETLVEPAEGVEAREEEALDVAGEVSASQAEEFVQPANTSGKLYLCPTCDSVPCGQCQQGCSPSNCADGEGTRNGCNNHNSGEVPSFCMIGKAVHQATTKLPNADTVEKAFQETLAEAAEDRKSVV